MADASIRKNVCAVLTCKSLHMKSLCLEKISVRKMIFKTLAAFSVRYWLELDIM